LEKCKGSRQEERDKQNQRIYGKQSYPQATGASYLHGDGRLAGVFDAEIQPSPAQSFAGEEREREREREEQELAFVLVQTLIPLLSSDRPIGRS